ncbi:LytR/AlgR family response regulator transcription factor [Tenacibaculum haliotis]|uniref:LytR/AlgR family response regulator transcription factor n=1 Tax=Tenacibaculum haliotis TaxID=1888914 RepID=UPI0021AE4EA4|nr:LytTR family DNA-binding domain-containing protein [Tenacibaculum haliotis]MCT4698899.1 LytTR family DNA-binding domain-containing protein [Tenacibaculum haliotis]
MLKIVIIEDEVPARKKLKNYLDKIEVSYKIVKEIETTKETLSFFETNPDVDLIFSDIELRDGNVFEIYNQIKINAPIIFISAYDTFWMNAFETSGIEYLLKPYSFARFEKAWYKYMSLKNKMEIKQTDIFNKLDAYYQSKLELKPVYKDFIPVKSNNGIYFLKVENIVFIQSDYGVLFAYDSANKKHLLNQTSLKEIHEIFNPTLFFKINRSEIVNRVFIEKINRYTKNTVAIQLKSHSLKTSQKNTAAFNSWMGIK